MGGVLRGLVSHGDACWQLEALAQPLRFPRVRWRVGVLIPRHGIPSWEEIPWATMCKSQATVIPSHDKAHSLFSSSLSSSRPGGSLPLQGPVVNAGPEVAPT